MQFVEQDETLATYAEKILPEDRLLDPARPAQELERRIRALHPHIGARLELAEDAALGVQRARVLPGAAGPEGSTSATPAPAPAPAQGRLANVDGRLLYGTGDGVLELLEVQPPGGRPMEASAYLRGHGLPSI